MKEIKLNCDLISRNGFWYAKILPKLEMSKEKDIKF